MCGIVGFSGSFEREALEAANHAQLHRGPDDAGLFYDRESQIGLAHRRLSILDLSPAGHQPMWTEDGRIGIIFNGEIYNFRELRTQLETQGFRFRSQCDTEVLLALYQRDGHQMLGQLNGIFAFAIWDVENRELFLARDAFGVKPLYFTTNAQGIAFASEIKGLLQLRPDLRDLDYQALHRYLGLLWCPGERTPFLHVKKLGPGKALIVQKGAIKSHWQWYQLPSFRGVQPCLSQEEAIQGTAEMLRKAVHRQMMADVPVGSFLSGGLDSSAVVAMARELSPNLHCFTISAQGGVADEGMSNDFPYAKQVAHALGVPLEVVSVDSKLMASELERMIWMLDEPFGDAAPLNAFYISSLARQQGIKVLLSGLGGDDVFSGYRRHLAVQYDHLWLWLPHSLRRMLEHLSIRLDQRQPLFRRLTKLFSGASLDGTAHLANYFVWMRENQLLSLYTPEFKKNLENAQLLQPLLEFLADLPEKTPNLEKMLLLEQRFYLADFNLTFFDKMSMAVGVEARVPFLDLELVEFAAKIPPSFKQRGRQGKWVLKKAMEPYLPQEVIYRSKAGFGAPLRRWMRYELKELLHDLLSPASLNRRGLFDPQAVQRLIAQNEAGTIDASYSLLTLLSIELWCRHFVDRSPPFA